jgi:Flp pilus assembly protein TadG
MFNIYRMTARQATPAKMPGPAGPDGRRRWFAVGSSRQRIGAAATEFAVVAPVFFMMVIGFIEFGRALMVQQVLINASRVGAREASTTGATTAGVKSAVEEYASAISVNGVSVTVSPDPATAQAGTAITVNTSVPYNDVSWMRTSWFLGGKTLRASSEMRKEGFQ